MDIRLIRRSNDVYVVYSVKDHRKNPPRPLDPDGAVTITITGPPPGSLVVVNNQPMTRVSKGHYALQWQSTMLSPLGVYTGEVRILHGGISSLTFSEALFDLEDEV